MSTNHLVVATRRGARPDRVEMVATIRSSFALVEPLADELGRHFYTARRPGSSSR
jgi:hypothetical protein